MGDPNQLSFRGATPDQEAILREITAWPGVPVLGRNIEIVVGVGYPNHGGATGMTLNSFIPSVDHIGTTYLHEYGHIYDYHYLTTEGRQAIIDLHNAPHLWKGGPYMERPAERFAATLSQTFMASEGYQVNIAWEDLNPPFTDIGDLSQESQDAIKYLFDEGITKGTTPTTYSPADHVTREQMALYLERALNP